MKTISGQVISSKPISLSKAASILSKFVSTDNGASHAARAYLRRASVSFDELVQLHKELRHSSNSGHKSKTVTEEHSTQQQPSPSDRRQIKNRSEGTEEDEEEKKHKKKKKLQFGEIGEDLRHGDEENLVLESERKKHRKKKEKERGNNDGVECNGGQVGEREIGKKRDKSQSANTGANGVSVEEVESEGKMEIVEEKKEERKKRKNGEVGDGETDGSEVMRSKKKKKRKTES